MQSCQQLQPYELRHRRSVVTNENALRGMRVEVQKGVSDSKIHEGVVDFNECFRTPLDDIYPDFTSDSVGLLRHCQGLGVKNQKVGVTPDDSVVALLEGMPAHE